MSDNLHIMRMKGSGALNLRLVDITLDNGVVKIGGKNRQGKSNILTMIQMLAGKDYMPEIPKNKDEKKGKFEIQLGDEEDRIKYIVKYSFTEKNSYISVEDAEGESQGIKLLQSLLSPCLNPWEFFGNATAKGPGAKVRLDKAIQIVREVMEFDFDFDGFIDKRGLSGEPSIQTAKSMHSDDPIKFLEVVEEQYMEARKNAKKKAKDLEGSIKKMKETIPPDMRDAKPVDVDSITTEMEKYRELKAQHDRFSMRSQGLEDQVARAEADLKLAQERLEKVREEANELPDISEGKYEDLQEQLKHMAEANRLADQAQTLKEYEKKLETLGEWIGKRDDDIQSIREEKTNALDAAEMPVEGLSIEDGKILKNGIPFGQDSDSEALEDAFRIGLAKFDQDPEAPKLKTLIIPNASLMDSESTARMIELAEENGVQLVMELVMDEREKGVIFVEDGIAKTEEEE